MLRGAKHKTIKYNVDWEQATLIARPQNTPTCSTFLWICQLMQPPLRGIVTAC